MLSASISPNASFAGDRSLTLTIEAKNTSGALVPGYRGEIDINPTAAVLGLPQSTIQGVFDEIFTASDAGRKVITNWGFASNGSQNVTVIDRTNTTRTATSNNVFVGSTGFRITFNTTTAVARDRAFTMTLEIVDAQGNRVPGYRGEIDINPSAPTLGLYQSPVQGAADYIFTAADAGIHTFGGSSVHVPGGWGFVPVGTNTITIIDRTDPSLTRTSQPLITTLPPEPQPVPVTPAPATETIPATIPAQPAIPYGWGAPMDMAVYNSGAFWKGYPKAIVPSGPGTRYVVTGSVKKGFWEWDWGSYYTGVYLGWENPPTSERHFGVTEYLPSQDTTFTAGVIDDGIRATTTGWLSGWSSYFNDDAEAFLGPYLSDAAGLDAQAAHIDVQGGSGNAGGFVETAATAVEDFSCDGTNAGESVMVGDPIDTRSGRFFLNEHDLGVATGCAGLDLRFERSYQRSLLHGGALGSAWVHNYEQRIYTFGEMILLQRPGGYAMFQDVGNNVYAGVPGSHQTVIKRAGGGWLVVYRTQQVDVFDSAGRLISQQDPNGNLIWFTYESFSREGIGGTRLARVDAPGGRFLWFGYDYYYPDRLILVQDNANRKVRFGYDESNRLTSVTNPLNQTENYHYDSYHSIHGVEQEGGWLLESKTDANGHVVFENTFDESGRVVHQSNNLGQDLTLSYAVVSDTNNLMGPTNAAGLNVPSPALLLTTTITDEQNTVTTLIYGSDGLLRKASDNKGRSMQYGGYTATREPTVITDALNRITTMSYNQLGLPTRITNPLNQSVFFAYNSWGMPTVVTDTLGHQVNISYQGPNLDMMVSNGGKSIRATYSDSNGWKKLLNSLSDSGMVANFEYNTAGELTAIIDTNGHSTSWNYDSIGRVTSVNQQFGVSQEITYDPNDQVTQIKELSAPSNGLRLSRITSFGYDPAGNLITVTNPLNQSTIFSYDQLNRVTNQYLPNQEVVGFGYNPAQGLTSITPPDRTEHRTIQLPLSGSYLPPALGILPVETSFVYNVVGELTEVQRPDGVQVQLGYDALGRTTAITQPQGITKVTYNQASGLPSKLIAPDGNIVSYGYNLNSQPITAAWSGAVNGRLTQVFNLHDQPTSQQINNLTPVSLVYDVNGRLTNAGSQLLTYSTATGMLQGSGQGTISDNWQYNQFAEPTTYQVNHQTGMLGITIYEAGYNYDALGRITQISETGTQAGNGGFGTTYTYHYDTVGQLKQVKQGSTVIASYEYDGNGNRISSTVGGNQIVGSYDDQDRLNEWGDATYSYNPNGELANVAGNNGLTEYAYDVHGNLLTVILPDETQISYIHDGLNRRIGKRVNGTLVKGWLYAEGLNPIAELDGNGQVVAQFIYSVDDHVPNVMIKNGVSYRIITNHLGSPRLVINTATGATVQAITYDPWGVVLSDINPGFQPFGFAGGLYDASTGLTRFGARDYNAEIGRWTSKDPLRFGGGDTNLYRYVGNDPINFIDPAGEKGFKKHLNKARDAVRGRERAIAKGAGLGFLMGGGESLLDQLFTNGCVDLSQLLRDAAIGAFVGGAFGGLAGSGRPAAVPRRGPIKINIRGNFYRAGRDNPGNLKPRTKDTSGLSGNVNPIAGQDNTVINASKLRDLEAIYDNDPPGSGHVSIRPRDMSRMAEWIAQGAAHPFTQELKAAVETVIKAVK